MGNLSSPIKICFFSGVPIDDAATLHRAGLVAKKLFAQGPKVAFLSVSANFKNLKRENIAGLPVLFVGQAHYFAPKPFSSRQRLGVGKVLVENLKTALRVAAILRRKKPDKVLVVTAMPISLLIGTVAKILRFKTLIDVEDLVVGQMAAAGYPKFLVKFYGFIEKMWVGIFDKVAVPSHYLSRRYPGSVILPNMVEVELWKRQKSRRTSLPAGKAEKQRNIVFVGQMGSYHGQEEVLENFAGLLKKRSDARLIFVGGGERLKNLKSQISNLKLGKQVVLTGQISQSEVASILATADIGVLPLWDLPVHKARHPLKLLEYLAAGLVVVTNNVGEVGRIIKDGQNGLLCPPGDTRCLVQKVEMILKNPDFAQKISQKAASSVQEFSGEKIFPKWLNFLEIKL